jgi:transcriptional regulator with XRE-family HTH domain
MNALSDVLRARVPDLPLSALNDFARQAGVSPKLVSLARAGKPINAGAHMAMCAAIGIDPANGEMRPVKSLSPKVVWWLLSGALYITRHLKKLDQRAAAKVIGVSPATVCRLERGQPVSIGVVIKICTFIGVHPDGYTAPLVCPPELVPRETPTETSCIRSEKSSDLAEADQAAAP